MMLGFESPLTSSSYYCCSSSSGEDVGVDGVLGVATVGVGVVLVDGKRRLWTLMHIDI